MRGHTDRATAEPLALAAGALLSRAECAVTMVDVQALVNELRHLPGVIDAHIRTETCPGPSGPGPASPGPTSAATGARREGGASAAAGPALAEASASSRASAGSGASVGFAASRPVGAQAWRQTLRVEVTDADAYRQLLGAVDAVADAAGRALRAPCRPAPEPSAEPPPLYHAITRHARALIVVVDPARGWTPLSETFGTLLGYDRHRPEVTNLLDLVHPEDQPGAVGTFITACSGSDPVGCVDVRLRTATGQWRRFEFAVRTFIGVPGAGIVAYFGLDVTTQRAAERALRVERGRLFSLVDTLRDGILLIDEHGRITVANAALRRLLHLAEPVEIGVDRSWARLLAKLQGTFGDGPADVARLRDIVAVRRAVMGEEVGLVDGRVMELDLVPLEGEGGPRGTLVHVRDATSRVAVRRGLEQRNRSLAEASALNNQFVATVAHELRGPLSSVVAFAHLLGDAGSGALTEDQRTYLDVIDRNSNRLLRLIEDLLLLSRLESRTLQLRPTPMRLPDLVHTAVTERVPAAEAAGLKLVVDVVDGPELICDETRIHQVLDNLLNNALKFTPPGGEVAVRARAGADGWQLAVADSGVGIPAGELARVFSAFFRGSNTAPTDGRPAAPGTGLGLVVSRAIVELHGGTIQVASTEGVGTTVTMSLPARPVRRTKDGGSP